jgi:hypothetical protein
MTWLDEIIKAFESLGGIAQYSQVYDFIKKIQLKNYPNLGKQLLEK